MEAIQSYQGFFLWFVSNGVCCQSTNESLLYLSLLVTLKDWVVLRGKLNYTRTNVGAKVQLHHPSALMVFSTEMLNYLTFA